VTTPASGPTPASPGVVPDAGPDALPDDAVEVARIVGPWGVKGGIKLKPLARDPQALFSSKRWFLRAAPMPRPAAVAPPPLLCVRQAKEHGDHVVATVDGCDDRSAAERLAGARVFVSRASFPTPAADEFYWVDLIGLAVHNRAGLALGTVTGLLETGPQCVLCIAPPEGGAEVLIPFVAAYVDRVDLAGHTVRVDWQPGD
jgi:16S rRNA processing protein RimM